MVRSARAAPPRHRSADGGRLRHRGAGADGGQRRAQFPVREADLQDPLVPFWIGREDASLGGLLQVLQLLLRVAVERRFRVLLNETVERLLRVGALAGIEVRAAEAHEDAVDRQRAVLALRELFEHVDCLVVLAGARLRLRQPEPRRLAVDAVASLVDHLLVGRGRLRRVVQRHPRRRFLIASVNAGVGRRIRVGGDLELRQRRLRALSLGGEVQAAGGLPRRGRWTDARVVHRDRLCEQIVRLRADAFTPQQIAAQNCTDDDEDGHDERRLAPPRPDHLARLPRERLELVLLEMLPFWSLHSESWLWSLLYVARRADRFRRAVIQRSWCAG